MGIFAELNENIDEAMGEAIEKDREYLEKNWKNMVEEHIAECYEEYEDVGKPVKLRGVSPTINGYDIFFEDDKGECWVLKYRSYSGDFYEPPSEDEWIEKCKKGGR